ncbi:MAG: DUF58 domain-containing protein [Euryarchaeota archaeon]|nr:DUF58 domain-containing protein [Euryarchaeota archaeon]
MRTRKLAGIIAGCLGLIILGLWLMDWHVLLYIVPLVTLLFIGIVWFSSEEIQISAHHQINQSTVFEDSSIVVTLTVKNQGDRLYFVELYDELPDRVIVTKGTNYAVFSLKQNEEITLIYEIFCPLRGLYPIGPLLVRRRDLLGLFYRETSIDDRVDLTVVTPVETIRDIRVKSRVNPYPGIMQTHRAGVGTEFHGVRTYAAGDSYKRINWKNSARWNNLMVNEFESESTTDVILMLDARENQVDGGSLKHNPLEYGIKAAATLASLFLKRRDRVGLIIYGESNGKLIWMYPESGNTQLYKLIKELVQIKPTGIFTIQAAINTAVGHMLPKKSLVVFISSLEGDPTLVAAVETLKALSFDVLIISPSPLDIEHLAHQGDIEYDLALKTLSLQRNIVISQLRGTGVRIVDWDPAEPLALALKEVEQYQIRR